MFYLIITMCWNKVVWVSRGGDLRSCYECMLTYISLYRTIFCMCTLINIPSQSRDRSLYIHAPTSIKYHSDFNRVSLHRPISSICRMNSIYEWYECKSIDVDTAFLWSFSRKTYIFFIEKRTLRLNPFWLFKQKYEWNTHLLALADK